ncbi:MAG: hypothetical protein U0361_20450 [Nitrospiraceae bacterium]
MDSALLLVSSYMAAQLIGISTAIDQAGTERMRIYRLAFAAAATVGPQQEATLRDLITQETARWEKVLTGLRYGTADHAPIGEIEPSVMGQIQGCKTVGTCSSARRSNRQPEHPGCNWNWSSRNTSGTPMNSSMPFRSWCTALNAMPQRERRPFMPYKFFSNPVGRIAGRRLHPVPPDDPPTIPGTDPGSRERLAAETSNTTLAVQSSNELGRLARTFEHMAQRTRQGIEELEALHATGQEISTLGIGGIEQVLRRIVDRAADLVRVDMAVIMVRHSVLECWIVEAASGQAFDTIRQTDSPHRRNPIFQRSVRDQTSGRGRRCRQLP